MTQAKIIIGGDDSPLRRALSSAREGLNKFGNDVTAPFAKIRDAMGNLGNIMAGLGAIKITALADQASMIQARLKDVTGSFDAANTAQAQLYTSAQKLQVGYADLAGSFSKMLPAVQAMGGGSTEAIKLAEILSTTARLAGSSSDEASASAQQFAQALASGVLQGDELKSILENNSTLARAMSQGLGVSVGELRKLGSEGKLTADKVASALLGQYDQIQARSAELPATVGGAWTQVTNAFQNFVAKANEGTGVFGVFSGILSGVAKLIDAVTTALGGTSKEADKLGRNNSIKQWAETVVAAFAWVIDIGRAVWEAITLVGKQIGAMVAAAAFAIKGEFSSAAQVLKDYESDFVASWERIKNLTTGGTGSVLQTYALGGGQTDANVSAAPGKPAKLKPTASAAPDKSQMPALEAAPGKPAKLKPTASAAPDKSQMPALEAALEAKRARLAEEGKLNEVGKAMELQYWDHILKTAKLSEQDRLAIQKKANSLRVDLAKESAKQREAIEKDFVQTERALALSKLEGEEIANQALADQDIITKSQAIQRQIEFEERRYQIEREYLDKRIAEASTDPVEQARLKNDKTLLGQDHQNKMLGLQAKGNQASPFNAVAGDIGESFASGFESILTRAKGWQASMKGIFLDIGKSMLHNLITQPLAGMIAGWARMLAVKLGFMAQEKTAEKLASSEAIGLKATETTAVVGAEAVKAGAGAASSQAAIPIVGPALAVAAMASIFAAVMAMRGKMKSARNGYDIPAGVNPMVQLHEEEMVLPKEQANAVRRMASGQEGGNTGGVAFSPNITVKAMDSRSVVRALRSGGALDTALRGLHRDFVRI